MLEHSSLLKLFVLKKRKDIPVSLENMRMMRLLIFFLLPSSFLFGVSLPNHLY